MNVLSDIATAVFLSIANKAIVDCLADPIRKRYPEKDLWWLVYVSIGTGAVVGWFSGINLFADSIHGGMPQEILGKALTALVIGGGASLIYKVFKTRGVIPGEIVELKEAPVEKAG